MNEKVQNILLVSISDVTWCPPTVPAGPKSFLNVELNLTHACVKDIELKPSALLCSVLQALAIQGELQNKIKLFSKCKHHY